MACAMRHMSEQENASWDLELDTIVRLTRTESLPESAMPKQHTYVLGLNVYDHDVSACLLRDGVIAFAIAKERITREKHATGFYKEVIDYCLEAEGISLRRCRSRRAQLLHHAGPGDGGAADLSGHAGLPVAARARAGGAASLLPQHLRQGGHDLAPSGACLQRLCGLAVRRRRGDDRRRRRQLPRRRHGKTSATTMRRARWRGNPRATTAFPARSSNA